MRAKTYKYFNKLLTNEVTKCRRKSAAAAAAAAAAVAVAVAVVVL